jgi:hypothetical protein
MVSLTNATANPAKFKLARAAVRAFGHCFARENIGVKTAADRDCALD